MDFTVPAASGNPTPAYAVQGSPPAGISFDTGTRVISGTPTAVGSGTIIITATNSEGSDTYTIPYTIMVSFPLYRLEVDWDGDNIYRHANSDVTNDWIELRRAFRGRNYGSQIYGRSVAGQLEARLDNADGTYSRFNANSPLNNLVVPGRGVRLMMRDPNGTNYRSLWAGLLYDIRPRRRRSRRNEVVLIAKGPLSTVTQRAVDIAMMNDVETGVAAAAILTAADVPAFRQGTIQGSREMTRWWTDQEYALRALRGVEETESGFVYEDRDGRIAMESGEFRPVHRRAATFTINTGDPVASAIPAIRLDPEDPAKDIANILYVPIRSYTVTASAVLWTSPFPVEVVGGGTSRVVAVYPTSDTDSDVIGVETWETLTLGTDYTVNSVSDGSGIDRSADLSVTTVEHTTRREIIMANASTTQLWVVGLQSRGQPIEEGDPLLLEFKDDASIDEYGPKDYAVPAQFISSVADANNYGELLLLQLKDPRVRTKVSFEASDYLQTVYDLELSTRLTLRQSTVEIEDMYVEAISHRIHQGMRHTVELTLAPVLAGSQNVIVLDAGPGLGTGTIGR